MVFDRTRNETYRAALEAVVTPRSVVLDLGAGVGILGLLAAKLGAAKVYLVEPATDLEAARRIACENNLLDRIEFVPRNIEQAELDESVDVIVSVFTGNFLLEEDLLPSLFYARDRYLKPGGDLIPHRASMMAMPVMMPGYHQEQVANWREPVQGLSMASMLGYAANHIYYDHFNEKKFTALAKPVELMLMDLMVATEAGCDLTVDIPITEDGELHGIIGWFDMALGENWLSTGPSAEPLHWRQAFLPLQDPVRVSAGETIQLGLMRPQDGEWSWRLSVRDFKATHSTFLGQPQSADRVTRMSPLHKPLLNDEGRAALLVLDSLEGEKTLDEIVDRLRAAEGGFRDERTARQFVQKLIERYGD